MSKILIVEDEEAIADLEKDYLELSGFKVELANEVVILRVTEEDGEEFYEAVEDLETIEAVFSLFQQAQEQEGN